MDFILTTKELTTSIKGVKATIRGSFLGVKISDVIDDFKMNQQIQNRIDKYNEYHLTMNYFTKFLMFY